ncbi:YHS domain-containing (seleno)protein [Microvirga calopogonii]|uniref:YHS domain-containing (seleno)protein n=1 Tax=Microvirga calopogonii TaxID=2078013 RepID=UPI0013B367B0|nr:YHS domain-containing (seleno)protein [Microvirga calopogonii]
MSWSSRLKRTMPAVVLLCCVASAAYAGDAPSNGLGERGIAIQGYDPVGYFLAGEPRKGLPEISTTYNGSRWLFSSESDKRRFLAGPNRYLPAYGGYCAYAVALGYLSDADPRAWTILYDRLYLNCPEPTLDVWLMNPLFYIRRADSKWPLLSVQIGARTTTKAGDGYHVAQ